MLFIVFLPFWSLSAHLFVVITLRKFFFFFSCTLEKVDLLICTPPPHVLHIWRSDLMDESVVAVESLADGRPLEPVRRAGCWSLWGGQAAGACEEGGLLEPVRRAGCWSLWGGQAAGACEEGRLLEPVRRAGCWSLWGGRAAGACEEGGLLEPVRRAGCWSLWGGQAAGACEEGRPLEPVRRAGCWSLWGGQAAGACEEGWPQWKACWSLICRLRHCWGVLFLQCGWLHPHFHWLATVFTFTSLHITCGKA